MNEVQRWTKKPVTIEAMRFDHRSGEDVALWCGGRFTEEAKPSDPTDVAFRLHIPTLEGVMTASPGDWIIKGVKGEFYPCKPDIFEASYELATAPEVSS